MYVFYLQMMVSLTHLFWMLTNISKIIEEKPISDTIDDSDHPKESSILIALLNIAIFIILLTKFFITILFSIPEYFNNDGYEQIENNSLRSILCDFKRLRLYIFDKIKNKIKKMIINPSTLINFFIFQPIIYTLMFILEYDTFKINDEFYVKCKNIAHCNLTLTIFMIGSCIISSTLLILLLFFLIGSIPFLFFPNNHIINKCFNSFTIAIVIILVIIVVISIPILYIGVLIQIFLDFHIEFVFPIYYDTRVALTLFVSNLLMITEIIIDVSNNYFKRNRIAFI